MCRSLLVKRRVYLDRLKSILLSMGLACLHLGIIHHYCTAHLSACIVDFFRHCCLISGYRVSRSILELVPSKETFRMALRAIRLWAQRMYYELLLPCHLWYLSDTCHCEADLTATIVYNHQCKYMIPASLFSMVFFRMSVIYYHASDWCSQIHML